MAREPLVLSPLSSTLSLLISLPSLGSANFTHRRVWKVGWGNDALDFCSMRESRAIWLAKARWGAIAWFILLTL